MAARDDNEVSVPFSISLDGETIDRLMSLSKHCRADPRAVAASLLRDLLRDDELFNEEPQGFFLSPSSPTLN